MKLGPVGLIIAGAIAIIVLSYDIITALWAPADPIIRALGQRFGDPNQRELTGSRPENI